MANQTEETQGMSRVLARFVHRLTYQNLQEGIRELAKTRILDALGASFAGRDLPHSRIAVEVARSSLGKCTIFGHSPKVPPVEAALANSVLAHSILQEDGIHAGGHPSTIVVPTAIAVAEEEGCSGKETLVAIAAGYEIFARMARATGALVAPAVRRGLVFGTIGAAAAAGKLMGLDEAKLAHALGYGACLTYGTPNEGWVGGTMEPMFEAGMCARAGIMSATLARAGATTAPYVLEGKYGFFRCWSGTAEKAALATDELGQSFVAASEVYVKPYPACGLNQMPIQVALSLAGHGLRKEDIEKVIEKVPPYLTSGSDYAGPFTSQFKAQMSMQFCAAAALLGRPVASPSFFSEHYGDPEVADLARKIQLVAETGRQHPEFEAHLRNGRVLVTEEKAPDNTGHIPARKNMEEKFHRLASGFLGDARAGQIVDIVMDLERAGDIRELTQKLGAKE